MPIKVFISAGDRSGDAHASRLMFYLKKFNPNISFIGIGGPLMEKQGLKSIVNLKDISVVGFWEVAKKYSFFKKLLKQSQELIQNEKVDLFLPIDYPGFNLRLAKFAKANGTKVIYYIAPQLWAWGENRAKELKESIDKLLVVFPFEVDFFNRFGIDTEFVGHPLLDDPMLQSNFKSFVERDNTIVFLPGSRTQELKRHLPLVNQVINLIKKELKEYQFIVAKPEAINEKLFERYLDNENLNLNSNSRELMQNSRFGLVKTGTSNLEAALCGMPFAMFYKTSLITYLISKKLITMQYISLVNILQNKQVISEFIQQDANPQILSKHIVDNVNNVEKWNRIQQDFQILRMQLGEKGASERSAKIITKELTT